MHLLLPYSFKFWVWKLVLKELWMWEVWFTAGAPSNFTCEKCTQLQLLTDHVKELELDELRIIREAEGLIERSYKEVITPK
eukprot:g42149.t1